jgi:uncharacterized membrane protein YeaQ/YmgE (transglycosylase-associated protein family)
MLHFIWWLIVGLVAGALARLIMPGKDPMGLLATILLGVLGSLVGGFVSTMIFSTSNTGFQAGGLIMSLLGAILLLWVWRMVRSRTAV